MKDLIEWVYDNLKIKLDSISDFEISGVQYGDTLGMTPSYESYKITIVGVPCGRMGNSNYIKHISAIATEVAVTLQLLIGRTDSRYVTLLLAISEIGKPK